MLPHIYRATEGFLTAAILLVSLFILDHLKQSISILHGNITGFCINIMMHIDLLGTLFIG